MALVQDRIGRAMRAAAAQAQPFNWRGGLLCMPAIVLLAGLGMATGLVLLAAVAAGSAFLVGFGATRGLLGWRWGAMAAAALGSAAMAALGSLLGADVPVLLAVASLAAALCAALALLHDDLWWVSLQCVIALLIADFYPNTLAGAAERAGLVLAGALVQIGIVAGLVFLFPSAGAIVPAAPKEKPSRRLLMGHMLRAAVCVALAYWAAMRLGLANAYWAPVTAIVILRPGLHETHLRGLARLAGTVAGCGAALLLTLAAGGNAAIQLLTLGLAAWITYALQKSHFAALSFGVTLTVVLLIALADGRVLADAEHRLLATLLGGAIALVVARIAPHQPAGDAVARR